MHVGQRLVDRLVAHGIHRVFGVPGGQTSPLYHAIGRRQDEIRHVLMRDERSAAFAADAYARITGWVGVCDATVGPGASNLVSGLLEAYTSSVPLLAIVGDIPRTWETRRRLGSASQGFDQRAFLEPCVKHYGRIELPENLDGMLRAALRVATSNRPGPAVLEIPDDVFAARWPGDRRPDQPVAQADYPRLRMAPDPQLVVQAAAMLSRARRPLILAGGGAHASGAGGDVLRLAEQLRAVVATTVNGKGLISETHPLAVGVAGSFGMPHVNRFLGEADCVLFIGTKAGQGATLNWTLPRPEASVIHIDIDGDELGRNFPQTLGLQADAKLGTQAILDALREAPASTWDLGQIRELTAAWWRCPVAYGHDEEPDAVKPQDIVRSLREMMSDEDLLVTDASLASGWGAAHWLARRAGRTFLAPRGLAGLGWGLPAAIGAALALGDRGRPQRVVCLAGDGGWAYSQSEVETCARLELPVIAVVLNNSVLAWTKHSTQNRYPEDKPISQDFSDADFAAAARALGAVAYRVDTLADFREALRRAHVHDIGRLVIIDAITSKDQTPVLKPEPTDVMTVY